MSDRPDEPHAAVAIVYARGPEEAVLLMRRTERTGDSWSGHWSFPGGHREARDAGLLDTALRELEEECGVRLQAGDLEKAMPARLARRASGPYLLVAPFVFRTDRRPAITLHQGEAAEALWVPLAILRDTSRHCLQIVPGRPPEMRFPAIALGPTPLWGFTYRLLTDWLGMLPDEEPLEMAGWKFAEAVLEFVLARGMTLRQPWTERTAREAVSRQPTVTEAVLTGRFPAAAVLEHFCRPGQHIQAINLIEVRADLIRVAGAAFEEYLLRSTGE
jgi:8-oxo-dGTP pyrophosphatase MutT (NUDIX family)